MKKTLSAYMRSLHRDIGYFAIGLTLLYALSGITLIYRDTGFLKIEKTIENQLAPNLDEEALGRELHMRGFKAIKTVEDIMYFQNGTYNIRSGLTIYTVEKLPAFLDKLNGYHKQPSKNPSHILSTVFAVSLLFLAVSSFWMFKPGSQKFKRGILFAAIGFVAALAIIFLV